LSRPGRADGKVAEQEAMSAGGAGKDQMQARVAAVAMPAWGVAPEPVQQAVRNGASTRQAAPRSAAAAAVALIVGYLVTRRWRRQ
jgi:hypothetical protein